MKRFLASLLLTTLFLSACGTGGETPEKPRGDREPETHSDEESSSGGATSSTSEEGIRIISPLEGSTVESPITVEAMIPGNWSFEAVLTLQLQTSDGVVLAETTATTSDDWMTTDSIYFEGTLDYDTSEDMDAQLVIVKANASGLPENDDSYAWDIHLQASEWMTVEHEILGISFETPAYFEESERKLNSLALYYWGETQIEGSEFFDGMSLRFEKVSDTFSRTNNLQEYAEDALDMVTSSITTSSASSSLSTTSIAGKTAYSFSYTDMGEFTVYMFKNKGGDVIKLSITAPDPESQGYATIVETIIDSISLI